MSDKAASSDSISPDLKATPAPRARKAAAPRARKTAKVAKASEPAPVAVKIEAPADDESSAGENSRNDWPEPASAAGGAQGPGEGGKRKRRRRKGKGQGNAAGSTSQEEDVRPLVPSAESNEPAPSRPHQPAHQPQRSKIDPELLAKMAWKIFLAEVSEEGVALIGDNDAKDLSRRCFRLAEIFIEEQTRRR